MFLKSQNRMRGECVNDNHRQDDSGKEMGMFRTGQHGRSTI